MKNFLVIFLCLFSIHAFSQVENGCITIDFESFPTSSAVDGMSVSDQYREIFGLSFSLADGNIPVLAQRGGAQTAFQSDWGADEPAPGEDVGDFFLTDDGTLSTAATVPIILTFDSPIDTFAGCILDLDFEEFFIITAFDEFGNVVVSDTITAGDPGTGDGLATCWGFNLEGCEGSVYSISYVGERTVSGGFGLALDNFSFCYSDIEIDADLINADCNFPGQITLFSTGFEQYEYSMDNINFSPNGTFTDLEAGLYTFYVKDDEGCIAPFEYPIFSDDPVVTDILFANTTCNEENGILEILVEPNNGAKFSLDGINFQESNLFTDLPADDYIITIEDENGCVGFGDATIKPSLTPSIVDSYNIDDSCDQYEGSIEIAASGGEGILMYSIDGSNYQESPLFENITGGEYPLSVVDELGCEDISSAIIDNTPMVILNGVNFSNAICGEENGVIDINATGGEGTLMYSIDGGNTYFENSVFNNLNADTYKINIIDINNCEETEIVTIESPPQAFLDSPDIVNTSCDENNGTINVYASPNNGVKYSIDGTNFQDGNTFQNLSPDDYRIYIIDPNGCTDEIEVTIAPSIAPEIDDFDVKIDECQLSNGSIRIIGSGGFGDLEYSIDGVSYYMENSFTDLPSGEYTAYVKDEMGCIVQQPVRVNGTPLLKFGLIDVTTPDCFEDTGVITLNPSGGIGQLMFSIDDGPFQTDTSFINLAPGEYEIILTDGIGCLKRQRVDIPIPPCPIYIPNVFSPNGDADNDIFQIFTNPRYDAEVLKYYIYDRWGELVYKGEDFSIHTKDTVWWDGYFRNGNAEIAVYTYMIEIGHPTGDEEIFAGTVTLVR